MHLLLPIRPNHRPQLAGRRHGREPCTTTQVHGGPLNHLALTISKRIILGTISMATWPLRRIRPGTPSRRLLGRSLVRSVVGRRPVDPRLVVRSPRSLHLKRVHPSSPVLR